MRKKLRWLLVAFGVFATVALLTWAMLPSHRIHKAAFDQIKEGMTKAEVESLFGVPAGVYCRRSTLFDVFASEKAGIEPIMVLPVHQFEKHVKILYWKPHHHEPHQFLLCWISCEGACVINFDANGIVQNQRFHPVWEPPLWQRVKDWFADLKW